MAILIYYPIENNTGVLERAGHSILYFTASLITGINPGPVVSGNYILGTSYFSVVSYLCGTPGKANHSVRDHT